MIQASGLIWSKTSPWKNEENILFNLIIISEPVAFPNRLYLFFSFLCLIYIGLMSRPSFNSKWLCSSIICFMAQFSIGLPLCTTNGRMNKMCITYNILRKNRNTNLSKLITYQKSLTDLEHSWKGVFEVAEVRNSGQVIKL